MPPRRRRDEAGARRPAAPRRAGRGAPGQRGSPAGRLAYGEIMRALGAVPPADLGVRPFHDHDGVRDLGAKVDPPLRETMRVYEVQRDAVRVYANPLVEAYEAHGKAADLHVGAHVVFRNGSPAADPRTLMLFGDSCSHFHAIFLTGLLAESFRELHFVWSANLDWAYVERVRPHLLLVEVAERFLARLPTDRFDVEAEGARRIEGRENEI